jgi:hypothetical protein
MIFGAERGSLALIGALVAYTVVVGTLGVVQRSQRLREQRVQEWNNVFRGGGGGESPLTRG